MFTNPLAMLHLAGTPPDDFSGWPGNVVVAVSPLRTNQQAAQYTLRVVPGGLSLMRILIQMTLLLSPCARKKSSKLTIWPMCF